MSLRLLLNQKHTSTLSGTLLLLIVVFVSGYSHEKMATMFCFCLFTLYRIYFNRTAFRKLDSQDLSANQIKNLETKFNLTIFATSIFWASAILRYWPNDRVLQLAVIFIIGGTFSGAMVSYFPSKKTITLFLVPITLATSTVLFREGTNTHYLMAGLMIFYYIMLQNLGRGLRKHTKKITQLDQQNLELLEELKEKNTSLERSNQILFERESETLRTDRLQSIGQMAAGIAHEVNNPLSVIAGSIQILEFSLKKGDIEGALNKADTIKSTVRRIVKVVNALRTFSKTNEKEKSQHASLEQIFENSSSLCFEQLKKHDIDLSFENPHPSIVADMDHIQICQILTNLITNAFDALQEAKTSKPQWIKISTSCSEGKIIISVKDSGQGIPEKLRYKIFEPFYSTKTLTKGTGLGLSLSKALVQKHGGDLILNPDCENTEFLLILRVLEDKVDQSAA